MSVDLRKLVGEARPFSYAAAVCAVALALCLELLLSKLPGASPSTTLFAVSIAVSAWYGGAGPGVLALILSAAAIDYLVVVPGTFLHFTSIGEAVLFACYIAGVARVLPADRTNLSSPASGPEPAAHGRTDRPPIRSTSRS